MAAVLKRKNILTARGLLVVAILFLMLGSVQGQSGPPWAGPFQAAVSELRSGDTAGALQTFDALWKSNSNDPQLAAWIGASLDSTAHHSEATHWYQRSLAIQPNFEPALNDLALNYATLGEFSRAELLLRQVLRLNPSNSHAAYNLGLIALHLRDYKEAAEAFQRARESAQPPASPKQLALAEASARFHLREYTQAAALLASIQTDSQSYLLLLGSSQALAGNLPPAIKTLQNAVRLTPGDPQAYYRLALVFMLGRLDKEAQDVLAAGLKEIPKSPLLLFGEAVGSDTQGKLDDALASAQESLDANPRQPQVWALLGRVYAELGQTDNALNAYQRAMTLGGDAQAGVDRAQLLIRLERFSEAEAELARLAKRYPNNASVDRGFGKLYREERQFDVAEKYIRHAIQLDPNDPEAHFALAEVLRLTHRMDESRKELAIFKEKKPAADATRLLELAANSSSEAGLR